MIKENIKKGLLKFLKKFDVYMQFKNIFEINCSFMDNRFTHVVNNRELNVFYHFVDVSYVRIMDEVDLILWNKNNSVTCFNSMKQIVETIKCFIVSIEKWKTSDYDKVIIDYDDRVDFSNKVVFKNFRSSDDIFDDFYNLLEEYRKIGNNSYYNNGMKNINKNNLSFDECNLKDLAKICEYLIVYLMSNVDFMFTSNKYIFYLECNLEPIENSQYFVPAFVTVFFKSLHDKSRTYIKNNSEVFFDGIDEI